MFVESVSRNLSYHSTCVNDTRSFDLGLLLINFTNQTSKLIPTLSPLLNNNNHLRYAKELRRYEHHKNKILRIV
jgi:hypothetical protein